MVNDDMKRVREYAEGQSEQAFEALVARHIHLVYSVGLRQTRDAHLAEEVTQAVFIILARKAASLSPNIILAGRLCRTARNVAANLLTTQRRRQEREQEAHMQSQADESEPSAWPQIAPLLDEALAQLGEQDHNAIVLRFFEGRSFQDVSMALGTSEDAAKKRVTRAVEKLRRLFLRRGITLSTAAIAGAVSANSVQAAPLGLAASVTAAAVHGTAVTASTFALTKTTLTLMAWTKLKTTVVVGTIAFLGLGSAFVTLHHRDLFPPSPKLAFVGYATPEATVQSMVWAASTGDMEQFLASFTPQERARFTSTVLAGKSDAEIRRRAVALGKAMSDFSITRKEVISADEIHVKISAPPSPNGLRGGRSTLILERTAGEWKRAGDLD